VSAHLLWLPILLKQLAGLLALPPLQPPLLLLLLQDCQCRSCLDCAVRACSLRDLLSLLLQPLLQGLLLMLGHHPKGRAKPCLCPWCLLQPLLLLACHGWL
jgi:hypothetical protein